MAGTQDINPFDTLPQNSAFGAKPQQVSEPVPGEQEQVETQEFFESQPEVSDFSSGGVEGEQAPEAMPQELTPEQEAQQLMGMSPEEEAAQLMGEDFQEDLQDPNSSIEGIMQQVRDFPLRAKVSFGVTRAEQMEGIEESVGKENVKIDKASDKIRFRKDKNAPWKNFDPDTAEFLNDVIGDNVRNIAEGLFENFMRLKGGIAGAGGAAIEGAAVGGLAGTAVAPGPGTIIGATAGAASSGVLGGIAGASLGGAVGAAGALTFGDFMQEKVFEISRDPNRSSRAKETAQAAAIGAGFNFLAAGTVRALSKAKSAIMPNRTIMPESLPTSVDEAVASINKLEESGLKKFRTIDGSEIHLMPNQMNPNSPGLQADAKSLSSLESYNTFIEKQGKMLKDTYMEIADAAGNVMKGRKNLGKRFGASVERINNFELDSMRRYQNEAMLRSKGAKVPVDRFRENLKGMMGELGLTPTLKMTKDGKQVFKISGEIDAPELTEGQKKTLMTKFTEFGDMLTKNNGQMSLEAMNKHYVGLTRNINKLDGAVTKDPLMSHFIKMKNSLRDDWTDSIEQFLPEGDTIAGYKQVRERISSIIGSKGKLNKALKHNEIARESLAKTVFNKSRTGLDDVRALKNLIANDDPALWRDLTGEWLEGTIEAATDRTTKLTDWKKVRGKFFGPQGLGDEIIGEMFGDAKFGKKELDALFKLGELTQSARFQAAQPETIEHLSRGFIKLLATPFAALRIDRGAKILASFGKEKEFAKFISREGAEGIMRGYKGKNKKFIENRLVQMAVAATAASAKTGVRKAQQADELEQRGVELPR